ncbi:FtsK/SpoIIIE domain-containing protein [Paeniglutamicibacter sp. R2-26]|uniref:FtsK/SpoIIIE domain-containing protein n=1 Tax=Paeniglutamicibacter sp. R2-26 TaxID=3144417 RepID=UPI003EE4C6CF
MAGRLFIRLSSEDPRRRALLELSSPSPSGGPQLAAALERHWPGSTWYLGREPLDGIAVLPADGSILLCDAPIAVPLKTRGQDPANGPAVPGEGFAGAALVVLEGPDPGGMLPLLRGAYSLGRGDADVRIDDPGLSRRHAVILVSDTSITLSDEGSANGTWFAETRIHERRMLLGERFSVGGSTLAFVALAGLRGRPGPQPGTLAGHAVWPLKPVVFEGREPPTNPGPLLLGAAAPLVVGAGLYLMTGSAFFLLFSTLSLVTGGLPAYLMLRARRAHRRALRLARAEDTARREELAVPIGLVAAGLHREETTAPDGFPPLALGHAVQRAWLRSGSGAGAASAGTLAARGDPAHRSPVVFAAYDGLCLALEGGTTAWAGLLRAMLVRWLPLLHAGALRVVVAGPAEFLPAEFLMLRGVRVCDAASDILGNEGGSPVPTVVLLAPGEPGGAGPVPVGRIVGRAAGYPGSPVAWIHCGWAPGRPHAQATVDSGGFLHLEEPAALHNPWLADASAPGGLQIEPATLGFETLARAVRRVLASADGTAQSPARGLPPETGKDPADVSPTTLRTVVGDADGLPLELDLLRHGPHLVVAGTTGSGKSELLRTLVLGLAREHGPHELAFMLVDFKGGATLAPLAGLPHVQNLVSDLDTAAARRVMEQLACELRRRERLLAAHQATDFAGYREARTGADPLLPALVVVVDEFRVLATELPGALEQVVQVATVGRSLGIHLVISTQRPAGTLNAQLRANITTAIVLRTAGEFESADLLGTDAAAHLDPAEPGWAYLRTGAGVPLKFRVHRNASTGGGASLRAWGRSLRAPVWHQGLDEAATMPQAPAHGTAGAVERIRGIWDGQERAANPFSPALPGALVQLPRAVLLQTDDDTAVGLVDRVESARRTALRFDVRRCAGLVACGLPGSGIEDVPPLLVRSLNQSTWTAPCFVLDGNGVHPELAGHPGVGGYFGPQDSWRIAELLLQLASAERTDPLVLVVSGLGGWAQTLGPGTHALLEAALGVFARTAQSPGRALVLCGDRELAGSRIASLCETRWYFPRGAGPEILVGWPKLKQVAPVRGRGLLLGPGEPETGTEFQLLDHAAVGGHAAGAPPRWLRNLPLPESLSPAGLEASPLPERPSRHADDSGRAGLPIGVCGPDNRVFLWSPGQVGVVIGPEGSGKGALFDYLAVRRRTGAPACLRFAPDDALPSYTGHLVEGRFAESEVELVLIDRADLRVREAVLALELLVAARIQVVFTTEPSARIIMELGLGSVVRGQHSFLVLGPHTTTDADPSGFRFVPENRRVPGRGLVWANGSLRQIQCVGGAGASD